MLKRKVIISTGVSKEEYVKIRKARELDPSIREYAFPDFGFFDQLNWTYSTIEKETKDDVWTFLADYISQYPKYERMKNIIMDRRRNKLNHMKP